VRRIEAVTADAAEAYIDEQLAILKNIKSYFKVQVNPVQAVEHLMGENTAYRKEIEKLQKEQAYHLAVDLMRDAEKIDDILFLAKKVNIDPAQAKNLTHQLRAMKENVVVVLAMENRGKVNLTVGVSDVLARSGRCHAGDIIRKITPYVKGGGGGQPQFAMAGGKDVSGIPQALAAAKALI